MTANVINTMANPERSPEKAGVGGSIPSLATIFNHLQTLSFSWSHYGHKTIGPLRLLIAALPPPTLDHLAGFVHWLWDVGAGDKITVLERDPNVCPVSLITRLII